MCGRLLYERVNLSNFDFCSLRSCIQPFDTDISAGLDQVCAAGPKQTSELLDPDRDPSTQ